MENAEQWQMSLESAEAYERYVARYILGPWAPLLVEAARVAVGEHVLDLACGTGVVARVAAKRVGPKGHVIGIDLNPAMLAVARTVSLAGGAQVEWLERSALHLELPDSSFDAVLCQQGLQFFPDKPLAMREMRRVLRPDGRLAISVWNSIGHYNKAVGEALGQFLTEDVAARFCASRRVPDPEDLARLAAEAGFLDVEVGTACISVRLPRLDKFALDHLGATPVAPVVAGTDAATRRAIGASVTKRLEAYSNDDGVSYPETTYVLRATKRT
jgi:ubiquinone/menaquinone biosynthesis C-methylase UbiE